MNKFGKDLTVGSIPKHLLAFSLPMLFGNLLSTGYSIVNTIWVGKIVGEDALAATAVSFPIIFILIALASGATMATTILVSQYYGAKENEKVEKVVNNSFSIAIILSIILTAIGISLSGYLLRLMNTPEQVFIMADGYLKISLLGFLFMYISFLTTSILRGIGDTVTPLIFMVGAVLVNAILDPLLIIGVGPFPKLGLNGAAYASLVAQGMAVVSAIIYLNKKGHFVGLNPKKLRLDKDIVGLIFKIGFPTIIQQSLVSIGAAFITAFVNAFGASAVAAFGVCGRIDSIAFMPAMSMSMATSALTGQNLGANKPERVKEIFKWGIIMTSVITLTISIITVSFPKEILQVFLNKETILKDASVVTIGVNYLRIVASGYILFAIMFVSNGIINGAGHTITTMIFSLLALWVVRVPLAAFLSKTSLGINGIWIAIVTGFGVAMIISLIYYFLGKWKKVIIKTKEEAECLTVCEGEL